MRLVGLKQQDRHQLEEGVPRAEPLPRSTSNEEHFTPYHRDSSQHQEFELNQPTATPPLHVKSIGHLLVVLRGPTSQDIFD